MNLSDTSYSILPLKKKQKKHNILLASVQDITSQFAIPSRIAHNSTMV